MDRGSPLAVLILCPMSLSSSRALGPKGPAVSTAALERWDFLVSASVAITPGSTMDRLRCEGEIVPEQVKSHARERLHFHWTNVIPSGLLPVVRQEP